MDRSRWTLKVIWNDDREMDVFTAEDEPEYTTNWVRFHETVTHQRITINIGATKFIRQQEYINQ